MEPKAHDCWAIRVFTQKAGIQYETLGASLPTTAEKRFHGPQAPKPNDLLGNLAPAVGIEPTTN